MITFAPIFNQIEVVGLTVFIFYLSSGNHCFNFRLQEILIVLRYHLFVLLLVLACALFFDLVDNLCFGASSSLR
jgi:hypothetical protein